MPILSAARRPGDELHVLQYAWEADERVASIRRAAQRLDVAYTSRPVWRTPPGPATTAMIVRGAVDVVRYARRHRVNVLMPRSIIPAKMCLLALRLLRGVKLAYHTDGLMADERVDFGGWNPDGRAYRALRSIEAAALRRADVVLALTEQAKHLLAERSGDGTLPERCVVVSNGKDAEVFGVGSPASRAAMRDQLGLDLSAPMVVYAGSFDDEKYNASRVVAFFRSVLQLRADAHLLILTGSPALAREMTDRASLPEESYTVRRVAPLDVPAYLAVGDVGLAFIEPALSMRAVAPIKVGEYLLCGLPVFATSGVGDLDDQLDGSVGCLTDTLTDESLVEAARWVVDDVLPDREAFRQRCRRRGLEQFSLERTVEQYSRAFRMLDGAPASEDDR